MDGAYGKLLIDLVLIRRLKYLFAECPFAPSLIVGLSTPY